MNSIKRSTLFLSALFGISLALLAQGSKKLLKAEAWITNPDKSVLFEKQNLPPKDAETSDEIVVDAGTTYQPIDGFGYTLTGGSALHIYNMGSEARKKILEKLFSAENGIGVSYLRLSIGASDLDELVFSYNDLPDGETDPELKNFSLGYDQKYLIPVLKEILLINPEIKLMGSPWSPPKWMKTNKSPIGGSLLPEYYNSYALYFVKYIEAYKAEGITIDAITVQNEPLHPGNNPSLFMPAEQQAEFIKNHLGPAFQQHNINTKIIIYDHNADRTDYPITVLNDTSARKYIDGSSFHLYGGHVNDISKVHEAHPDKNLYFTEQWIGAPANFGGDLAWHIEHLIIGATRNWCRNVLEWNLAADENQKPHTDQGGCTRCLGALTITGDEVIFNPAYYIIAHASKFVRPGSVRIGSNTGNRLPNVAFKTPNGKFVLIVLNKDSSDVAFTVKTSDGQFTALLNPGAVGTYVW
ncbi:MAG: glucosylceramidase [Bacteroidales bacterium]|nr:glucosylceramidase [Bacteroidales bacterium]